MDKRVKYRTHTTYEQSTRTVQMRLRTVNYQAQDPTQTHKTSQANCHAIRVRVWCREG